MPDSPDPTAVLRHVEWIPAADYSPDYCPVCDQERFCGHTTDCALAAALKADPTAEIARLRAEVERLAAGLREAWSALDRDRSGLAMALDKIVKEVADRWWMTEGRGPYEWDDDRYREEAGAALRSIAQIAKDALVASGTLVFGSVRAIDSTLAGAADPCVAEAISDGARSAGELRAEVEQARAALDRAGVDRSDARTLSLSSRIVLLEAAGRPVRESVADPT